MAQNSQTQTPSQPTTAFMPSLAIAHVRYSAWLAGELGRQVEEALQGPGFKAERLPRGILFRPTDGDLIGPHLDVILQKLADLETIIANRYPVFHHEMGPVSGGKVTLEFNPGPVA